MDLFLAEHALVHAPAALDPDGPTDDPFARGLSEAQVRRRPNGLNSVAWNLFHTARSEDIGMHVLLAGRPALADEEGWLPRLGVAVRHNGAGMDDAEVDALSAQVDVAALLAYRLAVGRRTRELLPSFDPEVLARPTPRSRPPTRRRPFSRAAPRRS